MDRGLLERIRKVGRTRGVSFVILKKAAERETKRAEAKGEI